MSHFAVITIVKTPATDRNACIEEAARLLEPYDENGEWFADGSRWDFWTLGGRFSGMLDGYDPTTDPINFEPCATCTGTGTRPEWPANTTDAWIAECNGCNGCKGKGTRLKYASHWKPHDGDILPLSAVRSEVVPVAIVTPDGTWHEEVRVGWWGLELDRAESPGDWRMQVRKLIEEHPDATAVLVDCHV